MMHHCAFVFFDCILKQATLTFSEIPNVSHSVVLSFLIRSMRGYRWNFWFKLNALNNTIVNLNEFISLANIMISLLSSRLCRVFSQSEIGVIFLWGVDKATILFISTTVALPAPQRLYLPPIGYNKDIIGWWFAISCIGYRNKCNWKKTICLI